jgi:signal transduction histidine kinase
MLMRALCNLIRNSIQHAGESGKVSVRAVRDGAQLVVAVTDSGVALAPEVGEQAFTAEGQLSTKNVSGGRYSRGLGLYAARIAAGIAGASVHPSRDANERFELRVSGR